MSVVIIGGNECMERQYQQICKKHGCKAKVFVKEKSGFSKQIGTPDLMILFTNTVSHKMVLSAVTEAKKNDVNIVRTCLIRNFSHNFAIVNRSCCYMEECRYLSFFVPVQPCNKTKGSKI